VDDPIKDMQEADSEVVRNNVWDWWDSTAETRVAPGGGVLGIQTRWNDDDWSGRLITQEMEALREIEEQRNEILEMLGKTSDANHKEDLRNKLNEVDRSVEDVVRWDVLSLPAMAEQTEYVTEDGHLLHKPEKGAKLVRRKEQALHPERYDEQFFRRKRKSSQPRIWSALYQQNPVPESGVFFTDDMFRMEPVVPDYTLMNVYVAWDLAIGQKHTNDWTVGIVGAHDFDDRIHILNVVRVRTKLLADLIFGTCKAYKSNLQLVGLEQGQIQMSIMPNVEKLMEEDRWYFSLDETLKPVTDKMARARPAQAWMQQGRILLPSNQPWVDPFKHELLRFPGGTFDDQVDALSWLVRMISRQSPPKRQSFQTTRKSWRDKLGVETRVSGHLAA
jgi:predicted phage terminase large subunit-like protein